MLEQKHNKRAAISQTSSDSNPNRRKPGHVRTFKTTSADKRTNNKSVAVKTARSLPRRDQDLLS